MSKGWASLPILPLRCIVSHLSMEDAMAVMSTCRHWHSIMYYYDAHRDVLKLKVNQLEKNRFLTRLFKKHAKNLHIYLECTDADLERFMTIILPEFFNSVALEEIFFIAPNEKQHYRRVQFCKLKRILTESLVLKNANSLKHLALMNCELSTIRNEKDRLLTVEDCSKRLEYTEMLSSADKVLSKCVVDVMGFSSLKHIILDHSQVNNAALDTLSQLANLTCISLNVVREVNKNYEMINWRNINACFKDRLQICLNIIAMPHKNFRDLMDLILVRGLPLYSLKIMFCRTVYPPLFLHVSRRYDTLLREFVLADGPHDAGESHRIVRRDKLLEPDTHSINPFVLLCWQCVNLSRLVIHGYWVWHYDLVGLVRLRPAMSELDVSSVCADAVCSAGEEHLARLLLRDVTARDAGYVRVSRHVYRALLRKYSLVEWKPKPWNRLHPALQYGATADHRTDFIVHEVRKVLGVT